MAGAVAVRALRKGAHQVAEQAVELDPFLLGKDSREVMLASMSTARPDGRSHRRVAEVMRFHHAVATLVASLA